MSKSKRLLALDLAWLDKQPPGIERDRIRFILQQGKGYYELPKVPQRVNKCPNGHPISEGDVTCEYFCNS